MRDENLARTEGLITARADGTATTPIRDRDLALLVARIVAAANPLQIYLFGSRTEGRHRPDSDYDLLVVMPDEFPAAEANVFTGYNNIVRGSGIPADVLVVRRRVFDAQKHEVGTMSHEVHHHGALIHERRRSPEMAGPRR